MALVSCVCETRALEGTWTSADQTIHFNRNGTGTLAIDAVGQGPQITRVFEWDVAEDDLVIEFIGYNITFNFSYRLNNPSFGMMVYLREWSYFFRHDEGTSESLVGFWWRPSIHLGSDATEKWMSFRFYPVGDDGFAWGVETDAFGVRTPIRWTTQDNTFTLYYLYEPDATTISKDEFSVDEDKLIAVINGERLVFNKVLN